MIQFCIHVIEEEKRKSEHKDDEKKRNEEEMQSEKMRQKEHGMNTYYSYVAILS